MSPAADLRAPPEAEPLALADLTDREREFVRTIRAIPSHRLPVLDCLATRLLAGMTPELALGLGKRDLARADAKHAEGGP